MTREAAAPLRDRPGASNRAPQAGLLPDERIPPIKSVEAAPAMPPPKWKKKSSRTDAHSAGVLVTPLGQQVCWQMGGNMLFDVPADQLRDLRPPPFRQGIERDRVALRAWI
jgi:hypothetical protein